jgi:hypothetical protein
VRSTLTQVIPLAKTPLLCCYALGATELNVM